MRSVPHPLFILAMDHRAVLRDLFLREGEDPAQAVKRFSRAKELAYEAMRRCVTSGALAADSAAVLIDGDYGGSVARAVREDGRYLIMPAEVSRSQSFTSETPEFILDGGDEFGEKLARYPVDMVKSLIVHNPALPGDRRARQVERAALVRDWCKANDVAYMIEVLTPPTPEQLAGGLEAFESDLHAELVAAAIAEFQAGGADPDVWKIEPLAGPGDYARAAGQARSGGRDAVDLVLLGGGADIDRAASFVSQINDLDGFIGFAIGRSVWQAPFAALFDGLISEEETIARVRANLELLVSRFQPGPAQTTPAPNDQA